MCDNTKLLSNRQLRRKINNAIQNVLLPSCTEANNFNSTFTNTQNLRTYYALGNNDEVNAINDTNVNVDIENECSPAVMLAELKSNINNDAYILYTDDNDSNSTTEIEKIMIMIL